MQNPNPLSQRRYDLDWLRVILILMIFVFHSGRFFDQMYWHVKNPATYPSLDIWAGFLTSWVMPTIFVISGASLFFAMGKGSGKKNASLQFLLNKVMRLLVPLVVGIFTHVSLAVYLERLTHHDFYGSYFEFLPHYFQGWYGDGGNFAWMGLHLWYLLVLFVFTLIFMPLFFYLRGTGKSVLRWLGDVFSLPGMVYLLALPIVWLAFSVSPNSPLGDRSWGGWSLPGYIPFFLYGFLIISHDGLQQRIRSWRWITLVLALASVVGLLYVGLRFGSASYGTTGYNLTNGLFGLNGWMWSLLILGFGMQNLNFSKPFLAYANEAVLPFYILHQTVLLGVGYFVVRWPIPDLAKFLVISSSSFVLVMLIYEFLIRRFNIMRFLFGMKPRPAVRTVSPGTQDLSTAKV